MAGEVAPAGSWVREREAGSWSHFLASMGGAFPPPGSSEVTWDRFEHHAFKVPGFLVVLGACAAVGIPAVLCCCPPMVKSARGPPPWGGFAISIGLAVICFFIGLVACIRLGSHHLAQATKEMKQAILDIWKAKRYSGGLSKSGSAVLKELALMYNACPQDAQEYLGNSVSGIESSVRNYNHVALHLSEAVVGLPQRLLDAEQAGSALGLQYSWQLALPSLILGLVACCAVVAAVAVQECAGPRVARRCERCQMPIVGLLFVSPVVVFLCTVASMELSLGIEMAAFCQAPDAFTLGYATEEFGATTFGSNMTRFYVSGKGSYEALDRIERATDDISSCIEWMHKYRPIIERTCPAWRPWNVTVNLQAVLISLNETERLLKPSKVYSHYSAVVHDFVCGSALSSIGWVMVPQVLLALVFLPLLSCSASFLLKGLSLEREMGHRFDLLAQDDELDMEQSTFRG